MPEAQSALNWVLNCVIREPLRDSVTMMGSLDDVLPPYVMPRTGVTAVAVLSEG